METRNQKSFLQRFLQRAIALILKSQLFVETLPSDRKEAATKKLHKRQTSSEWLSF